MSQLINNSPESQHNSPDSSIAPQTEQMGVIDSDIVGAPAENVSERQVVEKERPIENDVLTTEVNPQDELNNAQPENNPVLTEEIILKDLKENPAQVEKFLQECKDCRSCGKGDLEDHENKLCNIAKALIRNQI